MKKFASVFLTLCVSLFLPDTAHAQKNTALPCMGGASSKVRTIVEYASPRAGMIIIEVTKAELYLTLEGGKAIRYCVGVGREKFRWVGTVHVGLKKEWPRWTPPAEMRARRPDLPSFVEGKPGNVDNPLGARALYLYANGKDTLYRIHGSNEPGTIGHPVSSGCIRMTNEDIIDLYARVPLNTYVLVK